MKLVIDITEEQFKSCLCTLSSPFELSPVIESYCDMIANGTPLEEELETILAEEAELSEQSGFVSVAELISKRIAELKGENK